MVLLISAFYCDGVVKGLVSSPRAHLEIRKELLLLSILFRCLFLAQKHEEAVNDAHNTRYEGDTWPNDAVHKRGRSICEPNERMLLSVVVVVVRLQRLHIVIAWILGANRAIGFLKTVDHFLVDQRVAIAIISGTVRIFLHFVG